MKIIEELNTLASGKTAKQLARAVKLLVAVACILCVLGHIAGAPQIDYNGARLAPTFSILAGYAPFYPMDHGPILSTMYGPLTYLFYLPCGIFYHQVTLAIMSGSILSLMAFLAPVAVILWRRRGNLTMSRAIWLGILCTLQLLAYGSLSYSGFYIHADAPAMLFATLCILLLEGGPEGFPSWRAIFLSALCGTLAVWSKQILAPVLLPPLLTAFIAPGGWRKRLALLGWLGMLNALLFGIFTVWCGREAVLDNLWRIPAGNPIASANFMGMDHDHPAIGTAARMKAVVVESHILAGKYLAPYLAGVVAIAFLGRFFGGRKQGVVCRPGRLTSLFFLATLLALPGSAAAVLKAGGFINNESPFIWFLVLGFLSLMTEQKPDAPPETERGVWTMREIIFPVFAAMGLLGLMGDAVHLPATLRQIANPFANDQETAVRISRQYPGQCFFPWHPLAGLIAEHKLYDFEPSVVDRIAVGKGPTPEHYYENIPEGATLMAWPKGITFYSNACFILWPTNAPADFKADEFDWYHLERRFGGSSGK